MLNSRIDIFLKPLISLITTNLRILGRTNVENLTSKYLFLQNEYS